LNPRVAQPREHQRVEADGRWLQVVDFSNPALAGVIAKITKQTLPAKSHERSSRVGAALGFIIQYQ